MSDTSNNNNAEQAKFAEFTRSVFATRIVRLVGLAWLGSLVLFAVFVCLSQGGIAAIGDAFNITNTLFSGLAFAFLIYSIWQQQKAIENQQIEIKLQRKDIKLQIKEARKQTEESAKQTQEFEEQKKTLQAQLIEISFSNALNLFYSRINDKQCFFSVKYRGTPLNRHSYFLACHSIRNQIQDSLKENTSIANLHKVFKDNFGLVLGEFKGVGFGKTTHQSIEFEYMFFYCIKIEFLSFVKAILDMAVFIEKQVPEDQRELFHIRLVSGLSPEEIELLKLFIKIRHVDFNKMNNQGLIEDRFLFYSNEAYLLLEKSGLLNTTEAARYQQLSKHDRRYLHPDLTGLVLPDES